MENLSSSLRQKVKNLIEQLTAFSDPKLTEEAVSIPDLYEQVWVASFELDGWHWLVDLFIEEDSLEIFAIFAKDGLLYSTPVTMESGVATIGELTQVAQVFEPVANSLTLKRNANGEVRWFLIASSSVMTRSATINSKELFDNLIRRSEETGDYPFLTFCHLDESFKMGSTDWVARDGDIMLASGLFDIESEIAEALMKSYDLGDVSWGASISYWVLESHVVEITPGIKLPVSTDGMFYEISILPEEMANCLFTSLGVKTQTERIVNMDQRVIDAINLLAGDDEDLATRLIKQADDANTIIARDGLITQSAEEVPVVDADDEEEVSPAEDVPTDEAPLSTEGVDAPPEGEEADSGEEMPPLPAKVEESTEPVDIEIDATVIDLISEKVMTACKVFIVEELQPVRESVDRLTQASETGASDLTELRASVMSQMKSVEEKLSTLSATDEVKQESWLNDLPRNRQARVIVRPSQIVDSDDEGVSSEDIANQTLATIK